MSGVISGDQVANALAVLREHYDLPDDHAARELLTSVSHLHEITLLALAQGVVESANVPVPRRTSPPPLTFASDALRADRTQDPAMRNDVLGAVLLGTLDAVMAATDAEAGDIQLVEVSTDLDEHGVQIERRRLRIAGHRGLSREFIEFFSYVEGDETACSVAHQRRTRVIVTDVSTDPIYAGLPSREALIADGFQSVTSTPLITADDQCVAVVSTLHAEPGFQLSSAVAAELDRIATESAEWLAWWERDTVLNAMEDMRHTARR